VQLNLFGYFVDVYRVYRKNFKRLVASVQVYGNYEDARAEGRRLRKDYPSNLYKIRIVSK
jgi:hypothetical protein